MAKGILIVISAPSGGGKTTLVREIRARIPELHYSVSLTTRPARRGETSGQDYFFTTEEEFKRRRDAGELIESAYVHGSWYGTPREFIDSNLRQGYDTLLDIDVQGGRQIKKLFPDAVTIFITPPSLEILEARLRARRQDDEAVIERRLAEAKNEIGHASSYDYIILNDQMSEAIESLRCIIVAERLRASRNSLADLARETAPGSGKKI